MLNLKRSLLQGLLLAILAVVPFAGNLSAQTPVFQENGVRVETTAHFGVGFGRPYYGGGWRGGWGPYYNNYYYPYNNYYPYYSYNYYPYYYPYRSYYYWW